MHYATEHLPTCCAEGQYIANFTVGSATRTNATDDSEQGVITSIGATCTDGTELTPITNAAIGSSTFNFTNNIEQVVMPGDIPSPYNWSNDPSNPPTSFSTIWFG